MATDFLASVAFKRVSHVPIDAKATFVAEGMTIGRRVFTMTMIHDPMYPSLALIVPPAPGETETLVLRVGVPTLVGRLIESAVLSPRLDEQAGAAIDVLRGALAGMIFVTTDGEVNAMDLFGDVLDSITACCAQWHATHVEASGSGL